MKHLFSGKTYARLCLGLAAAVFSGMLWIGCESENPVVSWTENPPVNNGTGGNLALGAGEAWILSEDGGRTQIALVFKNGTLMMYRKSGGVWISGYTYAYTTSGGNITLISEDGDSIDGIYSVTNNGKTLLLAMDGNDSIVLTRTSGITIYDPSTPAKGGTLTLPSGQAWVNDEEEIGIIFMSNGTVRFLEGTGTAFEEVEQGTYTASGSNLTITQNHGSFTAAYSVLSSNNLVITILNGYGDEETIGFVKRTINIVQSAPVTAASIVLPSGQAWTRNGYDGYQFLSNKTVYEIEKDNGVWLVVRTGTYSIVENGNAIEINWESGYWTSNYSASVIGSTALKLDGSIYTATAGINVTPPVPVTAANIVLPSGQAWTRYGNEGYQFLSNKTVYEIEKDNGVWLVVRSGIYDVTDGAISITWSEGWNSTYQASRSGNALIFDGSSYTVTTGVSVTLPTPITAADLVLPSGQAWATNSSSSSHREGYQFLSDGTVYDLDYGYDNPGQWHVENVGTYVITNGGTVITVDWDDGWSSSTYRVSRSGNTLRFNGENYTAATGVTFDIPSSGGGVVVPTPTGGNLVLPSGQAWLAQPDEDGWVSGIIFNSNGTFSVVLYEPDYDEYFGFYGGTYSTNGANIVLYVDDDDAPHTGTYSVTGNTAVITIDGDPEYFTKTFGVYPNYDYYYAPNAAPAGLLKSKWREGVKLSSIFQKKTAASAPKALSKKSSGSAAGKQVSNAPEPSAVKPVSQARNTPERRAGKVFFEKRNSQSDANGSGWHSNK